MTAVALTFATAAWLAIGLAWLARHRPEYSHMRHTISELGETGSPDERLVAVSLFAPVGLALLLVAVLLQSSSAPAAMLALAIAIGYLGAAAFPCDPGSPLSGSWRQSLHNLAGGVEYVGGGFALMALSHDAGAPFRFAGFVVLGAAIALTVLPSTRARGAIQRIAEISLFGGLAAAAWRFAS